MSVDVVSFDPATGVFFERSQTTNKHGTFVSHDVGQAAADGTFTGLALPDPNQSTGRYAGATGIITFHGMSTATTVTGVASGTICVPTD